MKRLAAGSEIDAWCTKCRLNLTHRIVALVGGRPKRVECMTCASQHNYREPKDSSPSPPRTGRARPSKRTGTRPSTATNADLQRQREWRARVATQSSDAFTPYVTTETFALGELVLHRKFGAGYVSEVLPDGKLSIVFESGPRTLVHGGK